MKLTRREFAKLGSFDRELVWFVVGVVFGLIELAASEYLILHWHHIVLGTLVMFSMIPTAEICTKLQRRSLDKT